jgi:NAD(P)H-dependent FMN reductase
VVGICGSLRETSYTRMAVRLALEGAREFGSETELIDLREYQLAFCDGRKARDYPADVLKLKRRVKAARGIILGTPLYHGSFSGVLKNAIDLMGFDEFEGKMIGLVGVSGGRGGAIDALNSLRSVGRVLHAWVIPEQISIPQAWKAFDASGRLHDAELADKVRQLGRQVARFAYLHTWEQALEFLRTWESAPENPGGSTE